MNKIIAQAKMEIAADSAEQKQVIAAGNMKSKTRLSNKQGLEPFQKDKSNEISFNMKDFYRNEIKGN